jgi:hypothetical protein
MKERLLHFIWQNKLFNTKDLKTIEGNSIQIIEFGKYNKDGGPDFIQAKIKIDDIFLIGNIELHVRASDWKRHQHQHDKKYDTVILHVVYFNDCNDIKLPTLELNGLVSGILLNKYDAMMNQTETLICKNLIGEADSFTIENWKERLVIERMERKSKDILFNLKVNNNDWERTCYQLLGKYFGSHINKEPFELLTHLLDYKILLKHQDSIFQMEALLFGVAGFLNKDFVEIYPRALKQEYLFLKQKYNLKEVREHHWQLLRIRPVSFPAIRLAWFAQVIKQMPFMQNIISKNANVLIDNIEISEYWNEHYMFDKLSIHKAKHPGKEFKSVLQVNVFAAVLFAYGRSINDNQYIEKAMDVLSNISPENNAKTLIFSNENLNLKHAFDSQALIELHDNYCVKKRCLECGIGHKILRTQNAAALSNIH